MPRDNFAPSTREIIGQSVGFNCVRPGCAKPTTALNPSTGTIVSIGTAAHDSAASPGGPRYNQSLTPEQRRALENGAWLCPSCARLVDVDPKRFPQGTIQGWQQLAINYRQRRMNVPSPPAGLDFKTACENAQRFLAQCKKITFERWISRITWHSVCEMDELCRICHPLIATNPYCCQFPHMVNLQTQMIDAISHILIEMRQSEYWCIWPGCDSYVVTPKQEIFPSQEDVEKNAEIDMSIRLVTLRQDDFMSLQDDLRAIAFSPYSTVDLYSW